MGGALAQPCLSYPSWFPSDTLWDHFPFLLPNLVCVVVLMVGVVVGVLFLGETHPDKKHCSDPGLALGNWLIGKMFGTVPREYDMVEPSSGTSPSKAWVMPCERDDAGDLNRKVRNKCGLQGIFTRQVIFNIVAYGILA